MPGAMLGRNSTRSTSPSTIFIFCSAMPASPDPMSWLVTHSVDCWFAFIKQHTLGTSLEWSWWIVRTRRVSNRWDQGPCAFRNSRRTNTGRLSKANRPSNPEPDLVPETISPPYDRLPAQLQTLHLWALRRALPLVKTWGLTLPIRSQPPAESPHRQPTSIGENAIGGIDRVRFQCGSSARRDCRYVEARPSATAG